MSTEKPVTVPCLRRMKNEGRKIVVLTAYDYPFARLMDSCGIDVLLVGDSVGNAVLGYADTIPVTMEEMLHHVKAVSRAARRALVVADMPFMSYQAGRKQALENAGRFLKEGGAKAVKLEGGARAAETVAFLTSAGIPVMGHIGMTPRSVNVTGGYLRQGTSEEAAAALEEDARALEEAGAFAVVLELVSPPVAARVTGLLEIPTIGIGSGPDCDGQVLVMHDMLGMDEHFRPRHAKRYMELHALLREAFTAYAEDVRAGRFPSEEHS